jgi:hypothetical protein
MTVGYHFCVYGVAEPFGEDTRVWPKHVLVRKGLEVRDAWLVLEGIRLSGVCVVGLVRTGRRLVYSRISYDPSPEPPGNWGSTSTQGGNARWRRIRRKTAWARLALV